MHWCGAMRTHNLHHSHDHFLHSDHNPLLKKPPPHTYIYTRRTWRTHFCLPASALSETWRARGARFWGECCFGTFAKRFLGLSNCFLRKNDRSFYSCWRFTLGPKHLGETSIGSSSASNDDIVACYKCMFQGMGWSVDSGCVGTGVGWWVAGVGKALYLSSKNTFNLLVLPQLV